MLVAENLRKSYGKLEVLKGIDLRVSKGEVVSIVGASGAGKSTLLHILGTLDIAEEGTLYLENKNLIALKNNKLANFRNQNIGFIFQFHNLLHEFTALENVCMPGFISGMDKDTILKRGDELMEVLGLGDRLDHKPSEMSG